MVSTVLVTSQLVFFLCHYFPFTYNIGCVVSLHLLESWWHLKQNPLNSFVYFNHDDIWKKTIHLYHFSFQYMLSETTYSFLHPHALFFLSFKTILYVLSTMASETKPSNCLSILRTMTYETNPSNYFVYFNHDSKSKLSNSFVYFNYDDIWNKTIKKNILPILHTTTYETKPAKHFVYSIQNDPWNKIIKTCHIAPHKIKQN